MLDNIENKIINKIKKEKIKPLSKGIVLARKVLMWILISSLLLFSGLSISVLVLIVRFGDWDIYQYLGESPLSFFLLAFPYFWLLFVIAFFVIALIKTKKIEGAYRNSFIYYGVIAILATCLIAVLFSVGGAHKKTETYLADNSSWYRQLNYMRSAWDNPDKGLLSGVLSFSEDDVFFLTDFSGNDWELLFEDNFKGDVFLRNNRSVKLIGLIISDDVFLVSELRPWECGCAHCLGISETPCAACSNGICGASASCSR